MRWRADGAADYVQTLFLRDPPTLAVGGRGALKSDAAAGATALTLRDARLFLPPGQPAALFCGGRGLRPGGNATAGNATAGNATAGDAGGDNATAGAGAAGCWRPALHIRSGDLEALVEVAAHPRAKWTRRVPPPY